MRDILFPIAGIALLITMFLPAGPRAGNRVFQEKLVIGTADGLFLPVRFDHRMHADYCSCAECHHHTTGTAPSDPYCLGCHPGQEPSGEVSCRGCHSSTPFAEKSEGEPADRFHTDVIGVKGAYHISCINCHEITSSGPTECTGCHELSEKGKDVYRVGEKGSKR